MNARILNAYEKSQKLGLSGRALEAEAFLHAARAVDSSRMGSAIKGLRLTHSLWTILQAELLNSSSRLPKQLKSDLLDLSLYVDKEITRALVAPSRDRLKTLCDINRNLAAGLILRNH